MATTITLQDVAAELRSTVPGITVKGPIGLGGNVLGLVVDVPGMPSDQCVLVTVDDGQLAGPVGDSEWEFAANYWEGEATAGPEGEHAGRRVNGWSAAQVAADVAELAHRVAAWTYTPAALVDPEPAETYGVKDGGTWPPQSGRYSS